MIEDSFEWDGLSRDTLRARLLGEKRSVAEIEARE
jgi:hypothetical protein